MSNLSKKALRTEIWSMLDDNARKTMQPLKRSYLNSMMADAESYANGKILTILKKLYGCNGIESIEEAVSGKGLKVTFKKGDALYFSSYPEIIDWIKTESCD